MMRWMRLVMATVRSQQGMVDCRALANLVWNELEARLEYARDPRSESPRIRNQLLVVGGEAATKLGVGEV